MPTALDKYSKEFNVGDIVQVSNRRSTYSYCHLEVTEITTSGRTFYGKVVKANDKTSIGDNVRVYASSVLVVKSAAQAAKEKTLNLFDFNFKETNV